MELWIALNDMEEQHPHLVRRRRAQFPTDMNDPVGPFGGVVPDPYPSHRLRESSSQDNVHSGQRRRRQRPPAHSAAATQLSVGPIDHRRGDGTNCDVTQVWVEVAVKHRAALTDSRRCPPGGGDGEPLLQQLADRRADADGPDRTRGSDHLSELAFGVLAGNTDGDRTVQTAAGDRLDTDVHAQLPGAGASLT
jgi:hypothetical protein